MSEFNKTSGGGAEARTGVGATPRDSGSARFVSRGPPQPRRPMPAAWCAAVRRAPSVVATSTAVRLGQVVAVLPAPSVLSC